MDQREMRSLPVDTSAPNVRFSQHKEKRGDITVCVQATDAARTEAEYLVIDTDQNQL